jgi:hypothetical protein
MEQHRNVREARRTFSDLVSTAAYGDQRIVVVRHKTEVGAFVGMDDLEFLRRYRPREDSAPAVAALEWDLLELDHRERLHARETAQPGGSEEWRRQAAAERELLDAERAYLKMLLALAKRGAAAQN